MFFEEIACRLGHPYALLGNASHGRSQAIGNEVRELGEVAPVGRVFVERRHRVAKQTRAALAELPFLPEAHRLYTSDCWMPLLAIHWMRLDDKNRLRGSIGFALTDKS